MGNSKAKYKFNGFGLISIQYQQDIYLGGNLLQGTIHLNMTQALNAKFLYIELMGREKVVWWRVVDKRYEKVEQKNKFVKQKMVIWTNPEEVVPVGIHQYQFSIKLPEDLPPTFLYRRGGYSKEYFRIEYFILASVECSNPHANIKPILSKRRFILKQPVLNPKVDCLLEFDHKMKTFFVNSGLSKVEVIYSKNNYNINECAKANIRIDRSMIKSDLKEVTLVLKRFLQAFHKWNRRSGYYDSQEELDKKVIQVQGNDLVYEINIEIPLNKIKLQDSKTFENCTKNKELCEVQKQYPNILLTPTCRTEFLNCQYYLEIHFNYKGLNLGSGIQPATIIFQLYDHEYVGQPCLFEEFYVQGQVVQDYDQEEVKSYEKDKVYSE